MLMPSSRYRGRQGPAVALKTRNNLLAIVLLLTSLPSNVKVGQETVEHACFVIVDLALSSDKDVSRARVKVRLRLLTLDLLTVCHDRPAMSHVTSRGCSSWRWRTAVLRRSDLARSD